MSIIVGFSSLLLLLVAATHVVALDTSEMVKAPQKVIIDTDIGRYMDDYFSIAFMVGHHHTQWHFNNNTEKRSSFVPPLIDIRLILTAYDNTTGRAVLTSMFLEKLGDAAKGIDIGIGLPTGVITNTTGHKGGVGPGQAWVDENHYDSEDFAQFPAKNNATIYQDGISRIEYLLDTEATDEDPILLLGIAPVINLGDLFGRRPDLKKRVVLVLMGGSINLGYGKVNHPSAEDNTFTNVTASQIVYHTNNEGGDGNWTFPIYAAPLDSSQILQIYGEPYVQFLRAAELGFQGASTLMSAYRSWFQDGQAICYARSPSGEPCTPEFMTPTLYDMQAGYMAIEVIKANQNTGKKTRNAMRRKKKRFDVKDIKFLKLRYVTHLQINGTGFTVPCCPSSVVPSGKCADCLKPMSWAGVHEALSWTGEGSVNGSLPVAFQQHAVNVVMGSPPPPQ